MTDPDATQPPEPQVISSQITTVLHNLLAERDFELAEHVGRVAQLAGIVAPRLSLPEEERASLVQASLLHDVGKLAIPETILRKPDPLTADEWEVVRQHTLIGAQILTAAGALPRAVDFVRSSHERVDGGGYPDGLSGEEIPLGARIIAVCDAYDAMTSPRPYRPSPMSDDTAAAELQRCSGTHFDPAVVTAVCAALATAPIQRNQLV
jgi:two-component system cell cycle response regulator